MWGSEVGGRGLGFRLRISCLRFRVQGLVFRVQHPSGSLRGAFRVLGFVSGVRGLGLWVSGWMVRVLSVDGVHAPLFLG